MEGPHFTVKTIIVVLAGIVACLGTGLRVRATWRFFTGGGAPVADVSCFGEDGCVWPPPPPPPPRHRAPLEGTKEEKKERKKKRKLCHGCTLSRVSVWIGRAFGSGVGGSAEVGNGGSWGGARPPHPGAGGIMVVFRIATYGLPRGWARHVLGARRLAKKRPCAPKNGAEPRVRPDL